MERNGGATRQKSNWSQKATCTHAGHGLAHTKNSNDTFFNMKHNITRTCHRQTITPGSMRSYYTPPHPTTPYPTIISTTTPTHPPTNHTHPPPTHTASDPTYGEGKRHVRIPRREPRKQPWAPFNEAPAAGVRLAVCYGAGSEAPTGPEDGLLWGRFGA